LTGALVLVILVAATIGLVLAYDDVVNHEGLWVDALDAEFFHDETIEAVRNYGGGLSGKLIGC
jgi:hypothetical protein